MKITLNTSFEVRNRWFLLLCRHRRYATRENATPLYLPRPRNERAPHYRYICAQSVYIGTSVTRFVYNVQRPNMIFILCDLVLAMVCVKRNSPLVYSSRSRGHGTAISIMVTNTIDSRAYLTTVCCQEKWSGKYLTYRSGGYGPAFVSKLNGVSFLHPPTHLPQLEITSDASGTWGCGARHHRFQLRWDYRS